MPPKHKTDGNGQGTSKAQKTDKQSVNGVEVYPDGQR